jgi:hypothetical protein
MYSQHCRKSRAFVMRLRSALGYIRIMPSARKRQEILAASSRSNIPEYWATCIVRDRLAVDELYGHPPMFCRTILSVCEEGWPALLQRLRHSS